MSSLTKEEWQQKQQRVVVLAERIMVTRQMKTDAFNMMVIFHS